MRPRKTTTAKKRAGVPFSTETVWNADLVGTGVAENRSLTVGHDGEWAPEHLLLLAAESCFMSTLLSLASGEGITVLGYVSSGHLDMPDHEDQAPSVSLTSCVVVASANDARRIIQCAKRAERASVVARLLGDHLRITVEVRSVPPAGST